MATSCHLLQISFPKIATFSSRPLPARPTHHLPICYSSPRPAAAVVRMDPAATAVVDPALKHANVLFFKSGYNVQIVVEEDEPDEVLLRRFRREVSKVGVIQECKRRRYFENKQEEKKRRARDLSRKNRRRRFVPRFPSPVSASPDGDAPKSTRDDDDNWDLPEGDLPY